MAEHAKHLELVIDNENETKQSNEHIKSKRFEFINKVERNQFLVANHLCIAGGLNRWPNVLNSNGEFIGDAFALQDGRQRIEIWLQHIDQINDVSYPQASNDI